MKTKWINTSHQHLGRAQELAEKYECDGWGKTGKWRKQDKARWEFEVKEREVCSRPDCDLPVANTFGTCRDCGNEDAGIEDSDNG